jgi:hypothetical protein
LPSVHTTVGDDRVQILLDIETLMAGADMALVDDVLN